MSSAIISIIPILIMNNINILGTTDIVTVIKTIINYYSDILYYDLSIRL